MTPMHSKQAGQVKPSIIGVDRFPDPRLARPLRIAQHGAPDRYQIEFASIKAVQQRFDILHSLGRAATVVDPLIDTDATDRHGVAPRHLFEQAIARS